MAANPTPPAENRTAYRATLGISIVVGLGILLLVNYMSARHYRRFDWTSSGLYSLSEKTANVLKGLKAPVQVTVFMTPNSPLYREVDEILGRYKAKSSLITVENIDPTHSPARAQALVKEFGVRGGTVVFRSGDKKKYVTEDQLAEYDFSRMRMGGEPTIKAFKGEQEFTSALLTLTQEKTPKVVFTSGHGERKFDSRGRDTFFALAETLRRDNCTVEAWQSLGAAEVPAGTDCVIVAGPRAPFSEPEVAVLRKFLQGGGRGLFFLDAELAPGGAKSLLDVGLKGLMGEFGIRVDDDIVVDPKAAVPLMGPETFFVGSYRSHPITRLLEGSLVVFPLSRSIGTLEKAPEGVTTTILAETSAEAWGETNLADLEHIKKDDADVKAPVPVAAVAETKESGEGKKKTRIAVFGDADFAADGWLGSGANAYLMIGAANWVLEREALVAIPPKAAEQVSVMITQNDVLRLTLFAFVLLPLCAIATGVAVWIKRRR